MFKLWLAALLTGLSLTVCATEAPSASADPALEARVTAIGEELRCLVCQNQTIADSHAELAIDLKNQVREMLQKGMTEKEIKTYMVERYGDFVLYRPPMKTTTWLLWVGPFLLLLGGLLALILKLRQRAKRMANGDGQTLSADEHQRAMALLNKNEETKERA